MLDILLKQMGFDPQNLQKQATEIQDKANLVIAHFNMRLDAIEYKLNRICEHLHIDTPEADNVRTVQLNGAYKQGKDEDHG